MEPQLIAGGIAAAGFLVVVIGVATLASRIRSQPQSRIPGCLAWVCILLGGLVFVAAAILLAATK